MLYESKVLFFLLISPGALSWIGLSLTSCIEKPEHDLFICLFLHFHLVFLSFYGKQVASSYKSVVVKGAVVECLAVRSCSKTATSTTTGRSVVYRGVCVY